MKDTAAKWTPFESAVSAGIVSLLLVTGCATSPPLEARTETATVTATATVTMSPEDRPTPSVDPDGWRRDAQHVVDLTCRVHAAFLEFDRVASDLPANPQNFRQAKRLAAEVVFAIEGMSALLAMGPEEGWTDPWLALRALQFSEAVDGSRTYFESAAKAKSVDELIGLYFGVLQHPTDTPKLGDLPGMLPPELAPQMLQCASG